MTFPEPLEPLLGSGVFIDSANSKVADFARDAVGPATDPVEQVKRLYYRIRDDFRYDPYVDYADPNTYRASTCIDEGRGFCIPKAALMAASARTLGIPARVGFADVRNHLATGRLLDHLGSNIFVFHGYAEVWVAGRWVKTTPCFNITLCKKFGVAPLEFDGVNDAMLHPYDTKNRLHMEYLHQRGVYNDVPFDEIQQALRQAYPAIFKTDNARIHGDFAVEAASRPMTE
ncbi:MAG: transglutaminase [Herminiimonas sp.]|nr:transglutaminase [Herminiimonas sp.]